MLKNYIVMKDEQMELENESTANVRVEQQTTTFTTTNNESILTYGLVQGRRILMKTLMGRSNYEKLMIKSMFLST
jgi:hypothetical protein